MRHLLFAGIAVLALSGCESAAEKQAAATGEVEVTNTSVNDLSKLLKAARAKSGMQPGIWASQMHVVSADLSGYQGVDREAQEASIKRQERQATSCRKADELKPLDVRNLEQVAGSCAVNHYVSKGGTLDAAFTCTKDTNVTTVVAKGTMSPTAFDVTIAQETGKPGEPGHSAITLRANGKRISACS